LNSVGKIGKNETIRTAKGNGGRSLHPVLIYDKIFLYQGIIFQKVKTVFNAISL
jgi:hypothetical protein